MFLWKWEERKKCHSTLDSDSKLATMYQANISYDKKVSNEKITANCFSGCSACCNDFFFVSENEFLLILDSLLRKGGNQLVNIYKEKAQEYYRFLENEFPEIVLQLDAFMPQGNMEETKDYFNDNYNWNRAKSCIFLEDGRCSVYEERPHICRMYGVCNTCELINNKGHDIQEAAELIQTSIINGERAILKRPYPLFYFFSFFLNEPYYEGVLQKLTMIRTRNEKDYAKFTEQIMM